MILYSLNLYLSIASESALIVIVPDELKFQVIINEAPGSTSKCQSYQAKGNGDAVANLRTAPELTVTAELDPKVPDPETASSPLFTEVEPV